IILFETARGCWWGEKHHCTFCGLNASTMKFRSKAADQVFTEIANLSARHDTFRFRLVDNILEMNYIDKLFARFAEENLDFQFFMEVKSNLTRQQIKTLAHGGTNVIQPGIESFSQNQLKEMDKGVRPIQNIQCLKWSLYYGIEVAWNILTGFPGETDADYRQQIDVLKSLTHLQPPIGVGNLWLERFSPYFTRPEEYGIRITRPGEAYPYVYDGARLDLMKIAYDFEFDVDAHIDPLLVLELNQTVEAWKERHRSANTPFLFYTKSIDFITVYDGRPADASIKTRFDGMYAKIILFCDETPRSLDQIGVHLQTMKWGWEEIGKTEAILQELTKKRILFGEKGKYLTLALPHNSNH
ncbi:MAG: RiPP maturation radical SAM C-methyltransferase, partial [Nitrospinaceae bacterium]